MEDGERDPLIPHTEDNNDDDDRANTTQPFQPEASSTPGPSGEQIGMTTRNRPPERGPHTGETSFIKRPRHRRVLTAEDMVTREVEDEFPNIDKSKLEMRYRTSKMAGFGEGAIIEVKMRNKEK